MRHPNTPIARCVVWPPRPEDEVETGTRTPAAVAALMGLALAMARIPAYEPPRCAVVAALRLVARAALSPLVVAWRADDVEQVQRVVPPAAQRALQQAASLLRAVHSWLEKKPGGIWWR